MKDAPRWLQYLMLAMAFSLGLGLGDNMPDRPTQVAAVNNCPIRPVMLPSPAAPASETADLPPGNKVGDFPTPIVTPKPKELASDGTCHWSNEDPRSCAAKPVVAPAALNNRDWRVGVIEKNKSGERCAWLHQGKDRWVVYRLPATGEYQDFDSREEAVKFLAESWCS